MIPNFPLNVFKDHVHDPVKNNKVPHHTVPETLEIGDPRIGTQTEVHVGTAGAPAGKARQ